MEMDYNQLFKSALRSDVDDLFKQFNAGPLTFEHFMKCYKEIDFWTIFVGKITVWDSYELFEAFFQHVASLFFPTHLRKNGKVSKISSASFEMEREHELAERLFGIYLCYMAYFLQPQTEVKVIRITLEFAEQLPKVMDSLVAERQLHALFCLQRLITSKAFCVIPFSEEYNPLIISQKRQTDNENESDVKYQTLERLKNVTESRDIQFASELHRKYAELKRKLGVPSSLLHVKDDIKVHVADIVKEAEEKIKKDGEQNEKQNESILERMSALRHKAFTSEIRLPSHRRHRESNDEDDDEDDSEEEEGPTPTSSKKSKKARKKQVDKIQLRARMHLASAKAKQNRVRQATIGEGDLSDSELVRREVETDVADAIAKESSKKKAAPKKRTKSTTIESEFPSALQEESSSASIGGRRRSQRSKTKVFEGILLPAPHQTTGVTKEALKLLEKKRDTDQALEKLRAMKK